MRLQCPNHGCPLDVPDDLAGTQIRCPHCGEMILVEKPTSKSTPSSIQQGLPSMSLGAVAPSPASKPAVKLEHQIFDGLPPLALMIALRRQQAGLPDPDDIPAMTDDDWKALSAFESILKSVLALRLTLMIGTLALMVNLLGWLVSGPASEKASLLLRLAPLGIVVMGACLAGIFVGCRQLERVRLELPALLLSWSSLVLALAFAGGAVMNLMAMLDTQSQAPIGFLVVAALPFNVMMGVNAARSAWRVGHALDLVQPTEISHRLVEAMRYLQ